MASRESERKRLVNAALRQVRRAYRQADSTGEKFERTIDRLIARKTRPASEDLMPLANQFAVYKGGITALEKGLTDLYKIVADI